MIYGVISDVHSNLAALEAVLAELAHLGVDEILFLGDVVGYGADANACVELVGRAASRAIRGNHDRIVGGEDSPWAYEYSSDEVRDADLWSRRALTPGNAGMIRGLPPGPLGLAGGILLCHGSPRSEDEYLLSGEAAADSGAFLRGSYPGASVCFFGHTHTAIVLEAGGRALPERASHDLAAGGPFLVNPGSVGQPRDGDPRAAFGVFDAESRVYSGRRVSYDVCATQRGILRSGLPRRFADRLDCGR